MRNKNDPRCQIRGTQANFVGALKLRSYLSSRQCGEEQLKQRFNRRLGVK
jgi:hypothetical protein